jgi:hypothetical protein
MRGPPGKDAAAIGAAINARIHAKRAFDIGNGQAKTALMNADEKHFSSNRAALRITNSCQFSSISQHRCTMLPLARLVWGAMPGGFESQASLSLIPGESWLPGFLE